MAHFKTWPKWKQMKFMKMKKRNGPKYAAFKKGMMKGFLKKATPVCMKKCGVPMKEEEEFLEI